MKNRRTVAFGRKGAAGRADGATGLAREPREALNRPAKLLYGGGALKIDVTLRDLSENGARVVALRSLPDLDELVLAFERTERPACVVWQREGALGLRFTGPGKQV